MGRMRMNKEETHILLFYLIVYNSTLGAIQIRHELIDM